MQTSFVVGLALVLAAPGTKDAPKKEPPTIVGEWVGESGIRGGKPDNPPPGTTITFTKDGKLLMKEGGAEKSHEGTYTADPKKDPAEIDLVPPATEKGPTIQAIYKIEGDTLTMCFSMGGERPKSFDSPAGSQIMLVTCKRAKKE
jgi:uncharacterized protein (TIGR03067 family)